MTVQATLQLATDASETSLVEKIVAHAATIMLPAYRGDLREARAYSTLRKAAEEICGRRNSFPADVQRLLDDAFAVQRAADLALDIACDSAEAHLRAIDIVQRLMDGTIEDELDEESDGDADATWDEEPCEEGDEEPEEDFAPEITPDTGTLFADDSRSREIQLRRDELQKRSQPGYDRVVDLERAFCERYPAASSDLRDVLVSAKMIDLERNEVPIVNGAVIDRDVPLERIDPTWDYGVDMLIDAIVEARTQLGCGLPAGYTVTKALRTIEAVPSLGRARLTCPCCGTRTFGRPHYCERYGMPHLDTQPVLSERGFKVDERCIYSARRGFPFGYSVAKRTRHGWMTILPHFGYRLLAHRVRKRFTNSVNLQVVVDANGIHLSEQLPPLPDPGTPVGDRLVVHHARRTELAPDIAFDTWWMYGYDAEHPRNLDPNEEVVRYATAVDVITYRSAERTAPTIIERRLGGPEDVVGAIIGDRLDSPFGPRVSDIIVHPRKPKAQRQSTSAQPNRLEKLIRDGDTWKTVVLRVDPIDSFDLDVLQATVLRELRDSGRRSRRDRVPTGTISLIETHGILHAYELARSDEENRTYWDRRYDDGYCDAVEHLITVIGHMVKCPDCGVLESCHDVDLDFPCGRIRDRKVDEEQPTLFGAA